MKLYAIYRIGSSTTPVQTGPRDGENWHTFKEAQEYFDRIVAREEGLRDTTPETFEVREWRHIPSELRVTSAPIDYDGFGTHQMEIVGKTTRGNTTYRLIDIPTEHLQWQEGRNGSGMHPTMTVDEWVKGRENYLR